MSPGADESTSGADISLGYSLQYAAIDFFAVLNESTSWLVTQSVRDMVRKMPHHAVEDAQKASTRWIFTQNPPWALRGDRWK